LSAHEITSKLSTKSSICIYSRTRWTTKERHCRHCCFGSSMLC